MLMSIRQMIDLALGLPDQGVVNFSMLQTLLHVLAQQLHLLEQRVELRDGMSPQWKAAQLAASAAPTLHVSEYIITSKSKYGEKEEQVYQGEKYSITNASSLEHDQEEREIQEKRKAGEGSKSAEMRKPLRYQVKRKVSDSTQSAGPFRYQVKRKVSDSTQSAGPFEDSALVKLISQEEIRKEKVVRVIRQRADSKEGADLNPEPMVSGESLNIKDLMLPKKQAETIIVVTRHSPELAYESDEDDCPVLRSFVTLEKFQKLETAVQSLINPTNSAILKSARLKGSTDTISEMWKGMQVDGRLNALEQGIEEMSNRITNLASFDQPMNELRIELNKAISGVKEKEKAQLANLSSRWLRAIDVLQRKTDDTAKKINDVVLAVQKCSEIDEKVDDCSLQVHQLATALDEELSMVERQISSVDQNVSDIIDRMNAAGQRDRDYFDLLESNKKALDQLEELFENVKEMGKDRDLHNESIHALLEQIEMLKSTRPTTDELQEVVRTKADQADLNGVLDIAQFKATHEHLTRCIEAAREETKFAEHRVMLMIANLEKRQATKAELLRLEKTDQRIMERLCKLRKRLELAIAMVPGLAAASRKRLLSNISCMTCDTEVLMAREELKPRVPALPVFRNGGRDSGDYRGDDATDGIKKKFPRTPITIKERHTCQRWCGGSHTVMQNVKRVVTSGLLTRQSNSSSDCFCENKQSMSKNRCSGSQLQQSTSFKARKLKTKTVKKAEIDSSFGSDMRDSSNSTESWKFNLIVD